MVEIGEKEGRRVFFIFILAVVLEFAIGVLVGYILGDMKKCVSITLPVGSEVYYYSDTDVGNCTKNTAGEGYTCMKLSENITCGCVIK